MGISVGHFLDGHTCRRTQSTVGGVITRWVDLGCVLKVPEQEEEANL